MRIDTLTDCLAWHQGVCTYLPANNVVKNAHIIKYVLKGVSACPRYVALAVRSSEQLIRQGVRLFSWAYRETTLS